MQKKIPPPLEEGFLSGRPGSNRPPRPWQGRALPNELLPQDIGTPFRPFAATAFRLSI